MKSKIKTSINSKIWLYMTIFSFIILIFLWMFQILLLDTYYEHRKASDMKKTANEISKNYKLKTTEEFLFYLNRISFRQGICVELVSNDERFTIGNMNNECMRGGGFNKYKKEFLDNDKEVQKFTTTNNDFKNKTLIYGINLDNDNTVFISTSLVPVHATISILKSQFIYVTVIVLALSIIISFIISRMLANPIIKLTNASKELSKGNYDANFDIDTDILEIDELSTTLSKANKELQKTDELRKDLMSNVSHDLKTPLTMIKAYSEMVRDLTYKDKEKREKNLNTIIEEADRLNNLVNDILSLSVIESKMLILEKDEFDLTNLVKDILNRYEIYTEKDNYKFTFNYDKPVIIDADKAKIEQVLYNLINNAINFIGEDKEVIINFFKEKNNIKVEITDHGIGMDKDELEFIWDKYYRSKKNHKRSTAGTGLGLSIVKRILELHKYKYGVISEKNKGTTFYFIVPVKKK